MKLSVLLPWLCVAGSLAGLACFYSASQKKEAELVALRAESDQLQKLRADLEEATNNQSQAASDELARLRLLTRGLPLTTSLRQKGTNYPPPIRRTSACGRLWWC